MVRTAWILILIGTLGAVYALTIPVYKDQAAFDAALSEIRSSLYKDTSIDEEGEPTPPIESIHDLATERYFELLREQSTHHYLFFDVSLCIVMLGFIFLYIGTMGWRSIKAPASRTLFVALALLAGLLISVALGADIFQSVSRGYAPTWADSVGIPLAGLVAFTPIIILFSLVWCTLLMGNYTNGVRLVELRIRFGTLVPLFAAASMFCLNILVLIEGIFWLVPSGALWLYLFLSLAAGRTPPRADRLISH